MVRVKQYIELKGDSLVAPFNAPFALRLIGTGAWIKTGKTIRTKDFGAALQHVEFFNPALQRALADTMTADQQDKIYEPILPKGKQFFHYQKESTSYILRHEHTLLAEEAGLGKCSSVVTPVLTPIGWTQLGLLKVGDEVIGWDGKPTKVVGVYPQGRKQLYNFVFADGGTTNAGLEHLWWVNDRNTKHITGEYFQVRTTAQLLQRKSDQYIPRPEPVQHVPHQEWVDSYTLGVLLGDGGFKNCTPMLYISDQSIMEKITFSDPDITPSLRKTYPNHKVYSLPDRRQNTNRLSKWLKRKGLNTLSIHKHIPPEYLIGSIGQRLQLLRGLMDTDGSIQVKPHGSVSCTFHTRSDQLAKDVQQLVWSLGGVCQINKYDRGARGIDTQLSVFLHEVNPFSKDSIKGKKFKPPKRNHKRNRRIVSIEKGEIAEAVCIRVDNDTQSYICEDYIVTHNTVIMIAAMNSDKPARTLIICPATLKYNWKAELETWLTYDPGGISIADGDEMEDKPVIIINYDILNRHYDVLKDINWDFMICDEAHKLKSFNSMRTKLVFGGAYEVEEEENGRKSKKMVELDGLTATREVYATATPLDRNEHLWPLLTRVDPKGLGKEWISFAMEYCGAYSNGFGLQTKKSTNTEKLGVHLRARFMIRHYADDVLDLPPMIENTIMFPLTSVIMEETEETIKDNLDILKQLATETGFDLPDEPTTADFMSLIGETFLEQGDTMKRPEFAPMFNKMATIRKELGIAKLPLLISHIKEQAEVYDKITVFAYHREVIKALVEEFPDCVKIMGGMTAKQKHEAVDQFQNTDVKYFFGNITAAGEGVTLTKSHYQLFGEVDWNYTAMLQAKKRLHRISQTKTVNIDYLVIDESMDAIMVKKVVEKGRTVKGIFAE